MHVGDVRVLFSWLPRPKASHGHGDGCGLFTLWMCREWGARCPPGRTSSTPWRGGTALACRGRRAHTQGSPRCRSWAAWLPPGQTGALGHRMTLRGRRRQKVSRIQGSRPTCRAPGRPQRTAKNGVVLLHPGGRRACQRGVHSGRGRSSWGSSSSSNSRSLACCCDPGTVNSIPTAMDIPAQQAAQLTSQHGQSPGRGDPRAVLTPAGLLNVTRQNQPCGWNSSLLPALSHLSLRLETPQSGPQGEVVFRLRGSLCDPSALILNMRFIAPPPSPK